LLLIMHRQCQNRYFSRFKADRAFLLIMHILVCCQTIWTVIVFALSIYQVGSGLLVIYVSVITKVWLLTSCSYSWPRLQEACPLRNVTWGSCLGGTPAAGTAFPALDAPLEPAAGIPRRRRGRRPV
jgi:hypothetical protein